MPQPTEESNRVNSTQFHKQPRNTVSRSFPVGSECIEAILSELRKNSPAVAAMILGHSTGAYSFIKELRMVGYPHI